MQKQIMNLIVLGQRLVIITVIVATIMVSYTPYSYAGLVIRGGTKCSAKAFEAGAEQVDQHYIQGLSVNYTTKANRKADYLNYLTGITGYRQYCVAIDSALVRQNVQIQRDPIPGGNQLHAKLSGYSSDIAQELTAYPN